MNLWKRRWGVSEIVRVGGERGRAERKDSQSDGGVRAARTRARHDGVGARA